MVNIQPREKTRESKRQKQVTSQVQVRREEAANTTNVPAPTPQNAGVLDVLKESWEIFRQDMENLFNSVKDNFQNGFNLDHWVKPEKKAEHYLKQCWNYMAQNDVEKAREVYNDLIDAYESMNEGEKKTNIYYEVHDIYQRLSEVQ